MYALDLAATLGSRLYSCKTAPACLHACMPQCIGSALLPGLWGTGCATDEACGLLLASQPTSAQLALVLTMLALARASSGIAYRHHTPVSTGRLRALVSAAHWGRGQELGLLGQKMSFPRSKQDATCLQVGCSGGRGLLVCCYAEQRLQGLESGPEQQRRHLAPSPPTA